ncbi:SGNH/GDSL hydrolase family protein [Pedobacter montanisoli]|uniref:SGNH/GDSL hydrolase family protein n=1 Tax=Pedobacter montanisoli TaxID=2923277 RepID=A0ABS9ZUA4_9SPHI|nr:SGNH/GDSL hydrolase family protein [Pedobacter montanisoli]MCJ0742175.1 SGNH/GDSL hydrolase family protein [Pedobacter montanisoli]
MRIIFFGDSITQQAISKTGYINLLKNKLDTNTFELIGAGINGNKVYDLFLRLETDVIAKRPDLVLIYIGINDVWHKQSSGTGTDYYKFIKFYQAIIDKIQQAGSKIILCTPSLIGENLKEAPKVNEELDQYADAIRDLAKQNQLRLCDLRKVFLEFEQEYNPELRNEGLLTVDGVHLNAQGNALVAETILPFMLEKSL